jgi:hypothetical protein
MIDMKKQLEAILASEEYARNFHPGADDPKRRKRKPPALGGLHDIKSAAAKLNITEGALRAFVRDHDIKFINVGRGSKRPRYRFSDADLQEFIDKRSQESPPCQFSNPKNPGRSSGTASKSVVTGFMARRSAQLAAKLKNSKP